MDDDLDDGLLTRRTLSKLSTVASVHVARSGKEAISYMIGDGEFSNRTRFPFPTLVITDLNMADGDGFDVLEFLQANPGWSVIPKIIYSSSGDDDDVRTAFLLGASAYHVKSSSPAESEQLLRAILQYWSKSEVPPVDINGRLLKTSSVGRPGARYKQPNGGSLMKRPGPSPRER